MRSDKGRVKHMREVGREVPGAWISIVFEYLAGVQGRILNDCIKPEDWGKVQTCREILNVIAKYLEFYREKPKNLSEKEVNNE